MVATCGGQRRRQTGHAGTAADTAVRTPATGHGFRSRLAARSTSCSPATRSGSPVSWCLWPTSPVSCALGPMTLGRRSVGTPSRSPKRSSAAGGTGRSTDSKSTTSPSRRLAPHQAGHDLRPRPAPRPPARRPLPVVGWHSRLRQCPRRTAPSGPTAVAWPHCGHPTLRQPSVGRGRTWPDPAADAAAVSAGRRSPADVHWPPGWIEPAIQARTASATAAVQQRTSRPRQGAVWTLR